MMVLSVVILLFQLESHIHRSDIFLEADEISVIHKCNGNVSSYHSRQHCAQKIGYQHHLALYLGFYQKNLRPLSPPQMSSISYSAPFLHLNIITTAIIKKTLRIVPFHLTPKFELKKIYWELCDSQSV